MMTIIESFILNKILVDDKNNKINQLNYSLYYFFLEYIFNIILDNVNINSIILLDKD